LSKSYRHNLQTTLGAIEGRGIKTAEKMIKKELFDEGIIVKKERMAKIRLVRLRLKNFKGVKSFELNLDGGNMAVFGDNATGKTTLKDAFLWLLFDKDSQNRADLPSARAITKNGPGREGQRKKFLPATRRTTPSTRCRSKKASTRSAWPR